MAKSLPPLVLPSGQLVSDLLGQARAIRRRAMHVFAKLESDHEREHGKGMLEAWAGKTDDAGNLPNYRDFLNVVSKMMPKEVEESGGSVEDMLAELDRRAAKARVIDGSLSSSSEEQSSD